MRGAGLGTIAIALFATLPALADEPDKARCAAAYERAQELQRSESLRAARRELVVCRDTCPGRLRRDCISWIDDVDALMPTIVLRPRDAAGHDIKSIRVTIDGELLTETIDASERSVDPGDHLIRFEHPELRPAEVRVTLHGAERGREVAITLWPVPAPAPPPTAVAPRATIPSGHRPGAWALGIGGAAALAIGGGLAIAGQVKKSDLRSSCAPFCSHGDVDLVLALWWSGAAAAALGAIAIGVGAYLWFLPREPEKTAMWLVPNGVAGRF